MVRRLALSIAGALALTAPLSVASAQGYPGLQMTFLQPTATVGPNDIIDVVVTLTNTSLIDFNFDGGSAPGYGLGAFAPTDIVIPFSASTDVTADCTTGTFFGPGCSAGAYSFTLNTDASGLLFLSSLSLAANTSKDFIIGTFTPTGATPAGTYTFFNVAFSFDFFGFDSGFNSVFEEITAAQTCPTDSPSCGFSRTVLPAVIGTPEPATFGLVGLGIVFVGAVRRRRTAKLA